MAKNPAFPFYAQDYLVDTMRWTREAKSLHIDLLCESWTNGALSDNNGAPYGLSEDDLKTWQKIKHKWLLIESDGFFWINEKLEECRKNRKKFLERQIENGKKGGRLVKNNPDETRAF